jgi:hypothetical protein
MILLAYRHGLRVSELGDTLGKHSFPFVAENGGTPKGIEAMPTSANGKVAPRVVAKDGTRAPPLRRKNKDVRVREYLTEDECRRLIDTARKRGGRYGPRDALSIRMC